MPPNERRRRRLPVLGAVVASLALVGACGSDDTNDAATTAAATGSPTSAAATTVAATGAQTTASPTSAAATTVAGTGGPTTVAESMPASTEATSGAVQTEAELYELAKKEGQVIWYSPATEPDATTFIKAFEAKYPGISVEQLRLTSSPLAERFSAEREAGADTADAVQTTDPVFMQTALEKGWFTPLQEAGLPGYDAFPKELLRPNLGSMITTVSLGAFLYNTDLVSEADVPRTWDDLLDPKWKGEIIMPDPSTTRTSLGRWGALVEHLGEEYMAKFREQDVRFIADGGVATAELLAAGEASIMAPSTTSVAEELIVNGAPIGMVLPDATSALFTGPALNSTAKHPNAAKLFINFLIGPEGSDIFADPQYFRFSPYNLEGLPTLLDEKPEYYFEGERILAYLGLKPQG
jgi:ABC-type Fe3+ transport system substrate-binding protein